MGKTPDRHNTAYWSGGIEPWISIADLSKCDKYIVETAECISEDAVHGSGIKIIPENTVIMSFKLSIGKLAITSHPMYSNEAIMAFIDKGVTKIDPTYLYYLLMQKNWDEGTNKAVMGKTLNKATLSEVRIRVHTPEEQAQIVEILDKAQGVITARKKQLSELDDLVKARFVEMFGDPVYNTNNLSIKTLNELGSWNSGGTPSRTNTSYFTGNIDWYSAGELNKLYLDGSIEKITEDAINESSAKLFKAGSMLVGMYDTAAFKMGILKKNSASNQACACIEPNELVNIVWLYYALQLMKKHFLSQRRGVRQKNLNLGMIKGFEIPVAYKGQQDEFAAFVAQVDKSKVVEQKLQPT